LRYLFLNIMYHCYDLVTWMKFISLYDVIYLLA
jgi:hypothetical protein